MIALTTPQGAEVVQRPFEVISAHVERIVHVSLAEAHLNQLLGLLLHPISHAIRRARHRVHCLV